MAKLIISKEAEKNFSRLKKQDQKKIIKKLKLLQENPYSGKNLDGELKGFRSLKA